MSVTCQLVQAGTTCSKVGGGGYKVVQACNKIVGLECLRSHNLLTVITLYRTSIPRL